MGGIDLTHLFYAYIDRGQRFSALEDVNLHIDQGQFICIVGRSGCGKTTLLRLLAGLQQPQEGSICINGRAVTGPDTDRAVVFQNYTLFPWMTARKNVQFGIRQVSRTLSRAEANALADDFLERVGMSEAADKYPYQLSGGMQQRVAIARALAMDTDILLLDEPFGALDARNRRELQELLVRLWVGTEKTVIVVTHDINEAVLLADRILYMTPGKVAADISVKLPRPRNLQYGEAEALRQRLLELFYESGEMEESDETGM